MPGSAVTSAERPDIAADGVCTRCVKRLAMSQRTDGCFYAQQS
jgi:hypothetical protein